MRDSPKQTNYAELAAEFYSHSPMLLALHFFWKGNIMLEYEKHHKYFERIRMVALSVAKEATRYQITTIEVNEKHIVGTDGRRLACLDNFGIKPGRYAVTKCTKSKVVLFPSELEGNFPKYEDIIPEPCKDENKCNLPNNISIAHHHISKAGACIDIAYLKDYIETSEFYVNGKDRPVVFYDTDFVAVILPMNAN